MTSPFPFDTDPEWLALRPLLQAARTAAQFNEALLDDFQALLKRYPESRELAYEYGLLCWQMGKLKQAQSVFEQLSSTFQDANVLAALAQVLALQGQVQSSYAVLQQLLHLEPAAARSHYLLKLYYELLAQPEQALFHQEVLEALNEQQQKSRFASAPRSWELQGFRYYFDYFSHRTPLLRQLYLQDQSAFSRPVTVLEIGCFEGLSAAWMIRHLIQDKEARIDCIDPWDPEPVVNPLVRFLMQPWLEAHFDWNIQQALVGTQVQLRKHKARSADVLHQFQAEDYDLIYVDGSHLARDVLMDMVFAWRLLKPGGLMFCDDYAWKPAEQELYHPQMGIDAFLEVFASSYTLLHKDWAVVLQKQA